MANLPSDPLETRRMVRVVSPTEFVRVDPDRVVKVAAWLNDRGVRVDVRFDGQHEHPTLWYQSGAGPTVAEPGDWLGVQSGVLRGRFTDEQLATWRDA